MHAAVGDRMVVAATRVEGVERDGEITSTGAGGVPPYRVRWSDTGIETLFFPGPDAHVQHFGAASSRPVPPSGPAHVKQWRIDVFLFEESDTTKARVVLQGDAAASLNAHGQAQRRPEDPEVSEIGDEVAVSRALRQLSDMLLQNAAGDLAQASGHPVSPPHLRAPQCSAPIDAMGSDAEV